MPTMEYEVLSTINNVKNKLSPTVYDKLSKILENKKPIFPHSISFN